MEEGCDRGFGEKLGTLLGSRTGEDGTRTSPETPPIIGLATGKIIGPPAFPGDVTTA
jgi:hypothetical protein